MKSKSNPLSTFENLNITSNYKPLNPYAMSLTLRTDFGCTEAVIDDDCGLKRFYEVANILSDDLDIRFTNKEDDFDTLTWNFHYKGHILTLHYNIYTGISIYPYKFREAPRKDNQAGFHREAASTSNC